MPTSGFIASRRPAIRCFASRSICWRWPTAWCRWRARYQLDIIHAHYAIPHAAAAYLARQILAGGAGGATHVPRTITTLHGTDVTILGVRSVVPRDRGVLHRSVRRGDRGLGEPARRHQARDAGQARHRRDSEFPRLRRRIAATPDPALRARFCPPDERLVIHISNLRPVKQVDAVVRVFAQHSRRACPRDC